MHGVDPRPIPKFQTSLNVELKDVGETVQCMDLHVQSLH